MRSFDFISYFSFATGRSLPPSSSRKLVAGQRRGSHLPFFSSSSLSFARLPLLLACRFILTTERDTHTHTQSSFDAHARARETKSDRRESRHRRGSSKTLRRFLFSLSSCLCTSRNYNWIGVSRETKTDVTWRVAITKERKKKEREEKKGERFLPRYSRETTCFRSPAPEYYCYYGVARMTILMFLSLIRA